MPTPYICARCLPLRRLPAPRFLYTPSSRASNSSSASSPPRRDCRGDDGKNDNVHEENKMFGEEEGAMTRKLREMTEDTLQLSSRAGRKVITEAGFNDELRKQLEERIAAVNFRHEHRSAFAEVELPPMAGRGTRDIATAQPWTGEESLHDSSLRMLNDAHKPLSRGKSNSPGPALPLPRRIDTGRGPKGAAGARLAHAKERSGLYSSIKESPAMQDHEREQRFQELKDRFSAHGRAVVPGTIPGLASLANERIEDAIARGQFKNLPRGKKMERDYNASSPFIDTTEYFLNKMIQKQDIVPPWIEKQQELASMANKFRSRLRNDWKRHAARVIASKGGTLQEQILRADAYAKAELNAKPSKSVQQTVSPDRDHFSKISPSGEVDISSSSAASTPDGPGPFLSTAAKSPPPAPYPFRDPSWEATEASYLKLNIDRLNSLTRSYNLQAPDLAKKPYFSLARELDACYAEVAPQLASAIRERAFAPPKSGTASNSDANEGVVNRLIGTTAKVKDEKVERQYGFRQFWKDIWRTEKAIR